MLAATIQEISHKLPWIENGEEFAIHSSNLTEWRERRVTCSAADWRYQIHVKKYGISILISLLKPYVSRRVDYFLFHL